LKKIVLFATLLFFFILCYRFLWIFDPLLSNVYHVITQQDSPTKFNSANYQWISFKDLPQKEQQKFTKKTCSHFNYEDVQFIQIQGFERYRNIIGNIKTYQLLTPDRLIGQHIRIPNLNKTQYLLIDPNLLEKYLQLKTLLRQQNLDANAIEITSCFRNPTYNQLIGGATCSQHQFGKAIDIYVKDLNKDGKEDGKDRKLIVDLLENELIKNKGGIGTYKSNPKIVHFDTRDKRARW